MRKAMAVYGQSASYRGRCEVCARTTTQFKRRGDTHIQTALYSESSRSECYSNDILSFSIHLLVFSVPYRLLYTSTICLSPTFSWLKFPASNIIACCVSAQCHHMCYKLFHENYLLLGSRYNHHQPGHVSTSRWLDLSNGPGLVQLCSSRK